MKFRGLVASIAIACLAFAAPGCGSSSKSSSTTATTTAKSAVCSDEAALKNSVKTLVDPTTVKGGKSSISAAADQVKADADSLAKSVQSNLQPQVSAVKSAAQGVKTAAGDFGSGKLSDNLQKAGNAIAEVGKTAGELASSLAKRCPSS